MYSNSQEHINHRNFLAKESPDYNDMMAKLHEDAMKSQSIYYCGNHHSIETVSTHASHKNTCPTYSRGLFLGIKIHDLV